MLDCMGIECAVETAINSIYNGSSVSSSYTVAVIIYQVHQQCQTTPEDLAKKEKWLVTAAEPEFAYIYEGLGTGSADLLFSLKVPNSLLLRWSEVIKSIPGARVNHTDLLNFLGGHLSSIQTRQPHVLAKSQVK